MQNSMPRDLKVLVRKKIKNISCVISSAEFSKRLIATAMKSTSKKESYSLKNEKRSHFIKLSLYAILEIYSIQHVKDDESSSCKAWPKNMLKNVSSQMNIAIISMRKMSIPQMNGYIQGSRATTSLGSTGLPFVSGFGSLISGQKLVFKCLFALFALPRLAGMPQADQVKGLASVVGDKLCSHFSWLSFQVWYEVICGLTQ